MTEDKKMEDLEAFVRSRLQYLSKGKQRLFRLLEKMDADMKLVRDPPAQKPAANQGPDQQQEDN